MDMNAKVSPRRLLVPLALLALAATPAHATDYRFDTVHTQILFCVSHLKFSQPCGRLHVKSGFIRFDGDDWSTAKVEATIDIASVDMGDAAWSDKLRSRDFFADSRYPTASYVSTGVQKTGENTGVVHGQLTLLGGSHPLDLQMTFNRAGVDAYTLKYTAGFSFPLLRS